ncbi:MAG: DsbA family protein [Rhizobium sp.]|nr:DsbA family protein [Rhizobium sp.]
MKLKTLLSATAMSLALVFGAFSPASAFDDSQKKEIGAIVRDYLIAHPEVLIEVQQALEKKQDEARMAQAKTAVQQNHDEIFNSPADLSLGNPKGKVTIVEFFDYNCGFCKRAMPDMDALIKSNPEVRFVLKEFPILGQDSIAAHRVSDAFRHVAPEKYGQFHRELLGGEAHANEARALEVAASLGVSEEQIRAQMEKTPSEKTVKSTYALAHKLGITGTPSYILGDEAVFGAVGAEALSQKVANLGQCGKTAC